MHNASATATIAEYKSFFFFICSPLAERYSAIGVLRRFRTFRFYCRQPVLLTDVA